MLIASYRKTKIIPHLATCSYLPVGGTTHFSPWNPHSGSSRGTAVVPPGHTTDKVKILTLSFCGFVWSISTIGTQLPPCLLLNTNTGTRLPWALIATSPDTPEMTFANRKKFFFHILVLKVLATNCEHPFSILVARSLQRRMILKEVLSNATLVVYCGLYLQKISMFHSRFIRKDYFGKFFICSILNLKSDNLNPASSCR